MAAGNVILELDNEEVDGINAFRSDIAMTLPGTKRTLTIARDGDPRQVEVTIGSQDEKERSPGERSKRLDEIGIRIRPMSPEVADRLGYAGMKSVLASKAVPGSPAARAGLRRGTLIQAVNRKRVPSVSEFKRALAKLKSNRALLLLRFGGVSSYVVLKWG